MLRLRITGDIGVEIWTYIEGYEGLYQISNYGRVLSLNYRRTGKENILCNKCDKNGYQYIILSKNGITSTYKIHRLVGNAFLPKSDLPEINHIDEDKSNNRVENLEWCSRQYNCIYGNGLKKRMKAVSKSVLQYNLDGNFVKEWNSTRDIRRYLGFCNSDISKCCKGKLKTCKGYIWRYKD